MANSYVCRNYTGETGREAFLLPPLPPAILNKVNKERWEKEIFLSL